MKKIIMILLMLMLAASVWASEQAASADDAASQESPQSVSEIASSMKAYIAENGMDFLLNILAAAAVFIIGKWVAHLIARLAQRAMTKAKVDPTLGNFVKNIIYTALLIFVSIAALGQLGVKTGSFIAIVGAAGLAIGLAMQGSLSNFAAGVLLILFKPFKAGDYIEAGGTAGSVQEVHIFTTVLNSPDNCRIIVPNAQVTGGTIKNYTANETRRVDLVIGVSYEDDLKKAREVIEKVLKADERVLDDPAPVVAVLELADSSVNFVVRPWVNKADYWSAYFGITEKVKVALEDNGLTIPFPQRDVHMIQS